MTAKNYDVIKSLDVLKAFTEKLLAEGKPIGFDIETGYTGPNRDKGSLFIDWDEQFISGFSLTNDPSMARYVPVSHDYGNNVPEAQAWEIMKPVLETLPVIAHNMKFEKRNLRALDRKGRGPSIEINEYGDSMLQSYVLSKFQWHGLKELTKLVFGHEMADIKSLFPDAKEKDLKALRFNVLTLTPDVISYACEDAAWCLSLHDYFLPEVNAQRRFMYDLEMRIMNLLCDLEDAGHAVDWASLSEQEVYGYPFMEHMADAARQQLSAMSGQDESSLNFNSSKQVSEVLYERIGLSTTVMTKGGKSGEPKMSTSNIALEGLSREHPAIKKILETREVGNLAGRLKKWKNDYSLAHDSRVHANFNQVVVGSGRFSANDPSIQQLPKEWRWSVFPVKVDGGSDEDDERWEKIVQHENTAFGKHYWTGNFRDFCVAAPGTYLLGYDYSQIELRCMAGMSQEPALLEAFANDVDIHTTTGAMMLGKAVEDATKKDRAVGKTMNFALLYGMGEKSLGERLAMSPAEATSTYNKYFETFTKVSEWMDDLKRDGWRNGYIETHFKRKWFIWETLSSNRIALSKAERMFVNGPVQGTAADYMKIAMLRAKAALVERGWWMTKVRMINNLHDALTFEVDNDIDPNELRELLEPAVVWRNDLIANFPKIVADWELGMKWGSAESWKKDKGQYPEFDGTNWTMIHPEAEKPVVEPIPEPVGITHSSTGTYVETGEEFGARMRAEILAEREEERIASLIVTVMDMPTKDVFAEFIKLLKSNPGKSIVTIKTPEGSVDLVNYPTGITPEQQGHVSLILGGADVQYASTAEIDMEGLTL